MRQRSRRRRVGGGTLWSWAAIAILGWGALAMGSVQPWGYWLLLAGAAALGAAGLLMRGEGRACPLGRWLPLALLSIGVAVLLQLVPLSASLLGALSPRRASTIDALEVALRHPLSIDPTATAFALACLVALGLFFVGSAAMIGRTEAKRVAVGLMGVGTLVAAVGIVQNNFPPDVVYGAWEPLHGTPYGPFPNKNHFAGWMLMALPLTLGALCAGIERARRVWASDWRLGASWLGSVEAGQLLLVLCAAIPMAVALVQTESRAGMLGLAVAVTTFGGLLVYRTTRGVRRLLAASPLMFLLFTGVAVVGIEPIVDRFEAASWTSVSGRLPIWRQAGAIAQDFPLTGSGLNTFQTVAPFYKTEALDRLYDAAHNDYLQLAGEGGLLVGVPIVVTLGLFMWGVRRRFREARDDDETHWLRIGAVVGLCLIAAQELVDFSLQVPANAALFVVLAAIAIHAAPEKGRTRAGFRHPKFRSS